jgi:hypothetical protein
MAGNSNHYRKTREPPDRELMSVPEAARLLGVQAQLVHYWTKVGKIQGFRINGCIFRYVDVEQIRGLAADGHASDRSQEGTGRSSETIVPAWPPST